MEKSSSLHYTKTDLRRRGWNDKLIERFLGSPDKTKINMMHKSGPRICLYEANRVHSVEAQKDFIEIQQERLKGRKAAHQAVETKRMKMRQMLDEIEITVPEMDREILTRRAVDHYNTHRLETDRPRAYVDSDEAFLDRIRVNYLRHELTEYENYISSRAGKVGAADAYLEIKEKVLDAIAAAYPELWSECQRQAQQAYDNSFGP